jgi:hypothetical protein
MTKEEILIVKKERNPEKLKIKICDKETNKWSPSRYEKVIKGKDYNLLAYLFWDLQNMGYDVNKAFTKFKALSNEPELFFLE